MTSDGTYRKKEAGEKAVNAQRDIYERSDKCQKAFTAYPEKGEKFSAEQNIRTVWQKGKISRRIQYETTYSTGLWNPEKR